MFAKIRSGFQRAVVASGAVLAGALPALAEGGNENQIDTTVASNALSSLVTAIKSFITAAAPILVGLLGVGLGIILIWKVYAWIKKGTNKAG